MKRWPLIAILLIGILLPTHVRAQASQASGAPQVVYRCVETNGIVIYTNLPPKGRCKVLFKYVVVKPPVTGGADAILQSGTYTNRYGETVRRPTYTVNGQPPPGASAQCRDGTYSFSQHVRGTCSHHGGVAQWLR